MITHSTIIFGKCAYTLPGFSTSTINALTIQPYILYLMNNTYYIRVSRKRPIILWQTLKLILRVKLSYR